MDVKVGDTVTITCPRSKYKGVVGEIFEIQQSSDYAIVDTPKGTEERIERIHENSIVAGMLQSEKTRKTPILRWPKGDPQWFPLRWLVVTKPAEAADIAGVGR
jgi:hypothetical protein